MVQTMTKLADRVLAKWSQGSQGGAVRNESSVVGVFKGRTWPV